jgi:hypothetical protein
MELQDLSTNLVDTVDSICKKYGFVMTEAPLSNWPDEDQKFLMADEVKEVGKQLINQFRPDLKSYSIGYVFKQKASKKEGNYILGQAKTEGDLQKVLHGFDAVVIIGFDTWLELSPDQKFRLVHHEHEHFVVDPEKDKIGTCDHQIMEFSSTIEIFGPGCDADIAFIRAYQLFQKNNLTL